MTTHARGVTSRLDEDHNLRGSRAQLPVELGSHRAIRIYFRRLAILVSVAVVTFGLIAAFVFTGAVGAIAIGLNLSVLGALLALHGPVATVQLRGPSRIIKTATRLGLVLVGCGGILTFSLLGSSSPPEARATNILFAILAILLVMLVTYVEVRRAEVATATAAEQSARGVAFVRAGQLIVTALGDVTTARSSQARKDAARKLATKVIQIAQSVSANGAAGANTRAIFYEVDGDERLVRRSYWGRSDVPREDFDANRSENDQRIIQLSQGEAALLVNDVDNAPPTYFADYQGRRYKSFLAVPVRAGGRGFGVLIIDSDKPNSFRDIDVGYAIVLAGMLASALATADTSGSEEVSVSAAASYGISESADTVFISRLIENVVASIRLTPTVDRDFLENLVKVDQYSNDLHSLAESHAKRDVREINVLAYGNLRWIAPST